MKNWFSHCAKNVLKREVKITVRNDTEIVSHLTWATDEVNKASDKGYQILKTYEIWNFDKTSDDLFKGYI